jgi:hypothetical protein
MTAKLDTLDYTGRSGRSYTFRLYVWRTPLKAVPAVYIVTERIAEPNQAAVYKPVFVGSTRDISRVYEAHACQDCFDLHYANTIGVLREPNAAIRKAIELDLIDALHPPCNAGDAV